MRSFNAKSTIFRVFSAVWRDDTTYRPSQSACVTARNGTLEIAGATHLGQLKTHIETLRRPLGFAQLVVGMIRIPQKRHARDARNRLLEKLQAFRRKIVLQERHPRGVTGGPGKACSKPELNGVRAADEHNWYCRRRFSRVRSHVAAKRQQQIRALAH